MNKKLIALLAVVILAIVTYFSLGSILGSAVTTGVNTLAPEVTGTTVTLESAVISPFSGAGTLKNLEVGNPEGFSDAKAFKMAKVHVDAKVLSVLTGTIVVEEVIIQGPKFVYETKLTSSNIGKILDNVNKFAGSSEPPAKDTSPGKKIEIKRFVLEDAVVAVSIGGATIPVPVPRMELTNIGTAKGGVLPSEAAGEIMNRVLAAVSQAAVGAIAKGAGDIGGQAGEAAKKLGGGVKSLFDKVVPPKP